jgi:aryl-alcohol dehydrogenase-like predicted oxidoreductase
MYMCIVAVLVLVQCWFSLFTSICHFRFQRTGKRDSIYLATKFRVVAPEERVVNGTPEYARHAVEKSLKRLGVESIDLYYLHVRTPFNSLCVLVRVLTA